VIYSHPQRTAPKNLVPQRRLELLRLATLASKTSVSTIPPPGHSCIVTLWVAVVNLYALPQSKWGCIVHPKCVIKCTDAMHFITLGFYHLRCRHRLLIPEDAHILYRMFIVPGSSRCSVHFSRTLENKKPWVFNPGSLEFCRVLLNYTRPPGPGLPSGVRSLLICTVADHKATGINEYARLCLRPSFECNVCISVLLYP
jgi:hypothetical protein